MARFARVIAPGLPHHVTARGNRREPVFFARGDQAFYRKLLAEQCARREVEVWAYCLMPNHVHLILTPADPAGLALAIGETHRRYTSFINARQGWTGHLFQSRFASVVMDEAHLIAAARYVAMNPVRAQLAARPQDWPWSSVRAHLAAADDGLVVTRPLLDRIGDFAAFLAEPGERAAAEALRAAESTGRPLGDEPFIRRLEYALGRNLAKRRPGPKSFGDRIPIPSTALSTT
jgi:putative transposase